jgi:hypothetical protein
MAIRVNSTLEMIMVTLKLNLPTALNRSYATYNWTIEFGF